MKTKPLLTIAAFLFGITAAQADWLPGDGHKMHYPQLPDVNGWDVDATTDQIFDDWRCTQTGPVSDVHFWISWENDNIGMLTSVALEIWSDVPADADPLREYSHPGEFLWGTVLDTSQFQVAPWHEIGDQGWYSPTIDVFNPNDHQEIWQVNIPDVPNPYEQEKDTIYWLGIHLIPANGDPQPMAGWKTSLDHFNDDAVYYDPDRINPETGGLGDWAELFDPLNNEVSLDMAFVITPEPGSAMLALLGAGLCCLRRRKH
jgi:hypothetical protein